MRLLNIMALNMFAIIGLASCGMEDDNSGSRQMGVLEVGIAVKQPASESATRASVNTSNFPVSIVGKEGTTTAGITKEYATASVVPEEIPLAVGAYTASSHTPGDMEKKMTVPYYAGSADFTVTAGVTTQTTVTCKMQNSRIQMNYNADFLATFTAWTITIDDGSETVLSYDQTDTNPAAIYWAFGDNVASMTVNFRGTTSKGTVSDSRIFTKSQAAEHYDDDSEYFTGGETLIVNMKPAVSTSGEVTGIDVGLNIIFEDHTDEVEIPVNWDKPITISEPNGTNYLANGISFAMNGTVPSDVALLIKAPSGIQNLYLQIVSDNPSFASVAGEMGLAGNGGLDLTSADASAALSSYLALPTTGITEYTLTLTNLLNLLKTYTGVHKFNLKAVDAKDNESGVTLTVRVTEAGGTTGPTLTLPADVTYGSNGTGMPASADALIGASAGLESIVVKIKGGNAAFDTILADLKMDGQSFITGVDLVDNSEFNGLLVSVDESLSAPHDGDTQYTFPIGVFFTFLNATGATDAGSAHEFNIVVTDKNGKTATGIFKVTITQE